MTFGQLALLEKASKIISSGEILLNEKCQSFIYLQTKSDLFGLLLIFCECLPAHTHIFSVSLSK